jgi:hypothetical protein
MTSWLLIMSIYTCDGTHIINVETPTYETCKSVANTYNRATFNLQSCSNTTNLQSYSTTTFKSTCLKHDEKVKVIQ